MCIWSESQSPQNSRVLNGETSVCERYPLDIRWTNDKIKILGFHFVNVDVSKDNWEPTIAQIKSLLNIWCIRNLTFYGKVSYKFGIYQV